MKNLFCAFILLFGFLMFSCNSSPEYSCTEELTQCFEKALDEEYKQDGTDDIGYNYIISNYKKDTVRSTRIIIDLKDSIKYFAYFSNGGWFVLEDKTYQRFTLKQFGKHVGNMLTAKIKENPISSPKEKYKTEVDKIISNISNQINNLYFRAKNDRGVFPGEVEKEKLFEKIKYDGSYSSSIPDVDKTKFYIEVNGKKYFFPKVEDVNGTKWVVDGKEVGWLSDPNLGIKLWE